MHSEGGMRLKRFSGYVLVLALCQATGCGDSNQAAPNSASTLTSTTVPPSPEPTAQYRVTFAASWSRDTHPNMIPRNPHFSGLIGATHEAGTRFWEEGGLASEGIEAMAERGSKTPLDQEIEQAISQRQAESLISGGGINPSPGSVSHDFTVTREHPAVTLVSMLAPSPDWFVGVSAVSLFQDGDWVSELRVELQPYDAGTDSGTTYDAPDQDTRPPRPITQIAGPPLQVGAVVPPVGTFTFRRQ